MTQNPAFRFHKLKIICIAIIQALRSAWMLTCIYVCSSILLIGFVIIYDHTDKSLSSTQTVAASKTESPPAIVKPMQKNNAYSHVTLRRIAESILFMIGFIFLIIFIFALLINLIGQFKTLFPKLSLYFKLKQIQLKQDFKNCLTYYLSSKK